MVIIDRLVGQRGDARALLASPPGRDLVDISADAWGSRLEILRGLLFQRVRLSRTDIKVNFVDCVFEIAEFQRVQSNAHFWAAKNRWIDCIFESVSLQEMISPMNTFIGCHFTGASITNYKAYQTLFDGCTFKGCTVAGLRAQLALNRDQQNPDLSNAPATVLFRKCNFEQSIFEASFFDGIAFEDCSFGNVDAHGCDFAGIVADRQWWPQQLSDPFTTFMMKLLELIRDRCGSTSASYSAIQNYLIDYKTGRIQSDDFSACLYAGTVPDAELDVIAPELPKLMAKFPF